MIGLDYYASICEKYVTVMAYIRIVFQLNILALVILTILIFNTSPNFYPVILLCSSYKHVFTSRVEIVWISD